MNISKDKWINNINSEYKIPMENQIKLLNANAQFIVEMANLLKLQSYSITALAIYLCNYFFAKHSYLNYDRFIVGSSSILLASKIRDRKPQLKQLGLAYFNFIKHKLYKHKQHSMILNDNILEAIIEKIAIYENTLLKTIQFNFDLQLSFDYLEPVIRMYYIKENYYALSKMLLFDLYRTQAVILYDPMTVLIAALVLASQFIHGSLIPEKFLQAYRLSNNQEGDISSQDQQYIYHSWIKDINMNYQNIVDNSNQYGINIASSEVDPVDVLDVLQIFNQFTQLYQFVEENQSEFDSDCNHNNDIVIKSLDEKVEENKEQNRKKSINKQEEKEYDPSKIQNLE